MLKTTNAVRWDTNTNRVYFDVTQHSFNGRLIVTRDATGKIDMHIQQPEIKSAQPIHH
jgi:hypothetical protein